MDQDLVDHVNLKRVRLAGRPNRSVGFPVVMRYRVALYPSDEGFAVSCPALPGCWSQGATEQEALDSIRVAIQEYLAVQAPREGSDPQVEIFVDDQVGVEVGL